MNDARPSPDSIAATALRILSKLAAPNGEASAEWSGALVAALLPCLPADPAPPDDLIGPPAAGAGPRWHAEQLLAMCRERQDASAAGRARRRYHARMLGYALAPERAEFRPLVTILVPVYNRSGPLVEAVQSCIGQTWRPMEILVIDDGSSDDPAAALLPFGASVRIVHKPNGGVASARNLGIRLAEGDFIHLLDSDDLLCPTAIESKIAAFAAVADADLCYGQDQWIDMRVWPPVVNERHIRELANPIRSMIVEFAFTVPTVMMPRWRMLAMPPFEEDLTRSSDFRYWQRLGFAGIKVIGVRSLTAQLRRFQHSLQATPHPQDDSHPVALLRSLKELIQHPDAWIHAVEYTNIMFGRRVRDWFGAPPSPRIRQVLSELLAALDESARPFGGQRLSMLPMLAAMHGRIAQQRRHGRWPDEDPRCAYRLLASAVAEAVRHAAPVSERDIAFWTRPPDAPLPYQALQVFFAVIRDSGPSSAAPAFADLLLRKSGEVPRRRLVKLAARLRPWIGARLATMLAVRWMERHRG
ncbi:MAG TPA: glycosyltransferase family A protein [Dongiaceae bacterium]|nr:glycosyltransferase family A protein [Dongiaceae bacterium]